MSTQSTSSHSRTARILSAITTRLGKMTKPMCLIEFRVEPLGDNRFRLVEEHGQEWEMTFELEAGRGEIYAMPTVQVNQG